MYNIPFYPPFPFEERDRYAKTLLTSLYEREGLHMYDVVLPH
jgi:hypothetical protein